MKKKLLTLTLILSTAITTSHTMLAIAAASQGKSAPSVMAPDVPYEISANKGQSVQATGATVTPTDTGHTITSYQPGGQVTLMVNEKETKTIPVAYSTISQAPSTLKEGDVLYIHNPGAELRIAQATTSEDNTGSVNISNKYNRGTHGENHIKITAKSAGPVLLQDQNGNHIKTLYVQENN